MQIVHTLEPILKENPFFEGMDDRLIEMLVSCATNLRFDEKQYLFREGHEANWFYLIRQGSVSLELQTEKGGVAALENLGPGDVLGWSWLFPPYQWKFDARALSLVRVIAMDAECLRAKCEGDTELGYELMKRFAPVIVDRLQATRRRIIKGED
jgi:CRP-like cAMP-binding protein